MQNMFIFIPLIDIRDVLIFKCMFNQKCLNKLKTILNSAFISDLFQLVINFFQVELDKIIDTTIGNHLSWPIVP